MMVPSSMKAAVLVATGTFEVRSVPVPEIGPDDVLVEVSRCGLCGTDIHIFNGRYSADRLPLVPGHEFSGQIVRIGANVRGWERGAKVTADINVGCGA